MHGVHGKYVNGEGAGRQEQQEEQEEVVEVVVVDRLSNFFPRFFLFPHTPPTYVQYYFRNC